MHPLSAVLATTVYNEIESSAAAHAARAPQALPSARRPQSHRWPAASCLAAVLRPAPDSARGPRVMPSPPGSVHDAPRQARMEGVLRRLSSPTFVGRTEELAVLDGVLERAAGGVPAFAFIAGESGVGKSRLIAEFEARARVDTDTRSRAQVFVGHCLELGGTVIPYAPLLDALRPVARELAICGDELRDALAPETRAALAELMPEFGEHLDGLRSASPDERQGRQARLFEALLALLDRLGRDKPIVLVLEDLHWADASTRDFLTFLVRSARTEPLALIATYRSDEMHRRHPLRPVLAELERAQGVERLGLDRFALAEVEAQLTGILDMPPEAGLAERLYARAEGNALYTEELLAAASDECAPLPETLRDALLTRVERLSGPAQAVVRIAAVAERPFQHGLLEAMEETVAPDELMAAAREAVAGHVLVTRDDGSYAFRHALVGEAVYDDLLPGERATLHSAIAEALELDPWLLGELPAGSVAAELAMHYHAAHDLPRALAAVRPGRSRPRSASSPTARRCATSSARSRSGSASPTPRSAPGSTSARSCTTPPPRPTTPARPRAPSRSPGARWPRSTTAPTRCAPPRCRPTSASCCAAPATRPAPSRLRERDGAAAADAEQERAYLLEQHAMSMMLRGRYEQADRARRRGGRARAQARRRRRAQPRVDHARHDARRRCTAPRRA